MSTSDIEAAYAFHLRAFGLEPPVREFHFHPTRKWRFDFAWPDRLLAAEIEGGTYVGGRHVTGSGFEGDCQKHSAAAAMGWRVLRFTRQMVESGYAAELTERALAWTA